MNLKPVLFSILMLLPFTGHAAFVGSLYFGQVPAGGSEQRELTDCQDKRPAAAAVSGLTLSDRSLAPYFDISPAREEDGCLLVTVTFKPPAGQQEPYKVYGYGRSEMPQKERKSKEVWVGTGKPQPDLGDDDDEDDTGPATVQAFIQATINGQQVNLAPVRGIGVSRHEWETVIQPSGWRYIGHFTQEPDEKKRQKGWGPISFDAMQILKNRLYGVSFSDGVSLSEFEFDRFGVPTPHLNEAGEQYIHRGLDRTNWMNISENGEWLATLGLTGETILWQPSANGLQKIFKQGCDARQCGVLLNLSKHQPVFAAGDSCLMTAEGSSVYDTGNTIRTIAVPDDGDPRFLGETIRSANVAGMSSVNGALAYINEHEDTISECLVTEGRCDILGCQKYQHSTDRARNTAYSPDGRFLAVVGSRVNIWQRDETRVKNLPPNEFKAGGDHLVFHPDSELLVVVGGQRLTFLKLGDSGEMTEAKQLRMGEEGTYKPQVAVGPRYKAAVFNADGSRLYIGYNGVEGGVAMYERLQ
ncbi:hypothetical protein [Spongorhabdus nitratireducens]